MYCALLLSVTRMLRPFGISSTVTVLLQTRQRQESEHEETEGMKESVYPKLSSSEQLYSSRFSATTDSTPLRLRAKPPASSKQETPQASQHVGDVRGRSRNPGKAPK
jgi:hypothetical protein